MYEMVFAVPWYIPTSLIGAAIAIFIWANNRLNLPGKRFALALGLFATLWTVVSYLVETPMEKVDAATRQFVRAIVAQDRTRLASLLDEQAMAYNWNKPQIMDGAIHYANETGLKGARIIGLKIEQEGTNLVSYLGVWSQHEGGKMIMTDLNSQWRLDWRLNGDHWQLEQITPIQIGQVQRDQIEQTYLNRPVK